MAWQAGPHPDDRPRRPLAEPEPWAPRRTAVVVRPRADTPQVDALALMPLLPVVLALAAIPFTRGFEPITVLELAVPTAILQFVLALRDSRVLRDRGFVGRAPATLALVSTILYLGVRARNCSGHDPSASTPVRWAIGTTVAAVLVTAAVTGFFTAILGGLAAIDPG